MSRHIGMLGVLLTISGAVLIVAGSASGGPAGMMSAPGGFMMGGSGGGMMGGAFAPSAPGPGEAGFVAGTQASPRVVKVVAGPGYTFTPSAITVAKGETVTFEVTSMGGLVHEFMVGPADAVVAHGDGLPEIGDIGMMETKSLTYTFDSDARHAFACHVPGHYEAGMKGTITVAG